MTAPPVLRPVESHDLEELARLHTACFAADPWSPQALARLLAQPGTIALLAEAGGALAEAGGRFLGFVLLRRAADEAEVLSIGVAESARRQGLAAALLTAGMAWLEPQVGRLFLEVAAGNGPALALYRAFGFETVGRREKYYADGSDALVLRRDLSNSADRALNNL